MIFCAILFALCGVVAFYHYIQGFFSATISAICAAIAAVVALGWYEVAAPLLFGAGIHDQAASICLVLIFAIVYILPRLVIDAFVPGNVRVNFIVDKTGAAVMGLIAGLIGTGIVALAADALPFGPTVAMYSRFATTDLKNLTFTGSNGIMQDSTANDVVQADKIDPDDPTKAHIWLGQDDMVVNLAKKVSGPDGSLGNDHPMADVHPDLIDEYYGQRIGIQPGAKHTAVSTDQSPTVTVKGVYTPPHLIPQIDGEVSNMHSTSYQPPPSTVTPDADQMVLVVRMNLSGKDISDDSDNLIRYSAGAVRLVVGRPDNNISFKDYYPVATLDARGVAVANRPDDFLVSDMSAPRTVDFVFLVDDDHIMNEGDKVPFKLPSGSFVEFKRYATTDLSGLTVEYGPPPNPDKTPVIRRDAIAKTLDKTDGIWTGAAELPSNTAGETPAPNSSPNPSTPNPSAPQVGPEPGATGHELADSGLTYVDITTSNKLAVAINCGTGDDNSTVTLNNGVGGVLSHRQWSQLTVSGDTTVDSLGTPKSDSIDDLAVDPNNVLVQVHCTAPPGGSASQIWAWSKRVNDFNLLDATGTTYRCVGVWATVQRGTDHYIVVDYKNVDDNNHLQPLQVPSKGRPVEVWLAFQVPSGTPIAEIRFSGNTAMDNLNFKAQ